jgi:transposase-like protein
MPVAEVTCKKCGRTFTVLAASPGAADRLCFWCWMETTGAEVTL